MEFITFLLIVLFIFIVLTFIFLTFNIINPKKYITFISMSHLLGVVTTIFFIIININKERYGALGLIAIVTFLWSNFSAITALLQLADTEINKKLIFSAIAITIIDIMLAVFTFSGTIVVHKYIISTIYIILAFRFYRLNNKFIGYKMISIALIIFPLIQYYYGAMSLLVLKKDYVIDLYAYLLQTVTLSVAIILICYEEAKNKLENNIEDMNNLEKQYTQSQSNLSKAHELDRMKSEFIANISHDLRTPINILFSSIQLYELYFNKKEFNKDELDEQSYKMNSYLKVMRQNCCRLIKLVNNLIDISKIDAGFKNLNLKYCDVVSVIEDITTSVIPYAESRELYIEFDSQLEEKLIMCDVDNLERILLNLIANAIKFSPKEGVIRIHLMEEEKFIVVSIKDEGVGISKEMQEIIFKRFFQVSEHSTKGKEGSGIGLYLVKSLVEMQGGSIMVSSEINKGSEFTFTIPIIERSAGVSKDSIIRELDMINLEIELSDI